MGWYGLLGRRLSHSFSPIIHAELADYEYRLCEKEPDELEDFLRHGDFSGLNVTIPYKETVIPFCSGLSETARAIGSVNTLMRLSDGSLLGDNTDTCGFAYLLKQTGVNPAGGKTVVLGSGGSSLTAQYVLKGMGACEIAVISRKGPDNYGNLKKHSDAILLVNTTPVGMYPDNGVSPVPDLGAFPLCRAVIDLVYNPPWTELLQQARERGIITAGGLAMLAVQAKRAAELFTNAAIADSKIDGITAKIARLTRNIVLIGMPGCGKTSIGSELSKQLGREFADTDAWVVAASGKSVPDIITQDGEEAFRRLETDALRELCKGRGLVIATGGGVVQRPENLRLMRQNGVIVFLERDVSELSVSDRPLSQRDGIEVLAARRLPLYRQWSDYTVPVRGIGETAALIQKKLGCET